MRPGESRLPERLELRQVDQLIPYARNARTHSPEQIQKIAASIREFGFTNPILIADATILAGHGRLRAAREAGLDEVPVIDLSHLTETQRRAYVLADNRIALDAGWDAEMLKIELGALLDLQVDVGLMGFTDAELMAYLPDAPPLAPPPPGPTVTTGSPGNAPAPGSAAPPPQAPPGPILHSVTFSLQVDQLEELKAALRLARSMYGDTLNVAAGQDADDGALALMAELYITTSTPAPADE